MKRAKVRVTGNYVSKSSFTNRIDEIINLPIDFTKEDIVKKIDAIKYCAESYSFQEIEVLCVYNDEN